MMGLLFVFFEGIFFFLVSWVIIKCLAEAGRKAKQAGRTPNQQAPGQRVVPNQQAPGQRVVPNQQAPGQRVVPNQKAPGQRVVPNQQAPGQRVVPNQQTPGQRKANKPEILQRAASNAAKYKENQTRQELEQEHHHSEKTLSLTREQVQPVDTENGALLGNVEDLIVKGYEGNLSFERDFVAEALDMINSFI